MHQPCLLENSGPLVRFLVVFGANRARERVTAVPATQSAQAAGSNISEAPPKCRGDTRRPNGVALSEAYGKRIDETLCEGASGPSRHPGAPLRPGAVRFVLMACCVQRSRVAGVCGRWLMLKAIRAVDGGSFLWRTSYSGLRCGRPSLPGAAGGAQHSRHATGAPSDGVPPRAPATPIPAERPASALCLDPQHLLRLRPHQVMAECESVGSPHRPGVGLEGPLGE